MNNDKGYSLIRLYREFPDDKAAEKWFERHRWGKTVDGLPESIHCPHCGCFDRITPCPSRKPQPYFCGACRKRFSVRTGTGLSHSPIPLQKWVIGIYLYLADPMGINARMLSRHLELNYRSAWSMLQRIREGWPDPEPLHSRIGEIDETWFGGNDKRRHRDKQFGHRWRKGKILVVGMIDRETGRVAAEVIPNAKRKTLRPFAEKHLCPEGTLYSDSAAVYSAFGWQGTHETVNHKKGEYVRGEAHTNRIESFWALAKRIYHGTYRHVSPKYFPRYLNEIVGRYNTRGMDILDQMEFLVSGMLGKRLTYRDLLATEVPPTPFTHHRSKERANLSGTGNEGQPLSAGAPLFRVKISVQPGTPESSSLSACRPDHIIPPHPGDNGLTDPEEIRQESRFPSESGLTDPRCRFLRRF